MKVFNRMQLLLLAILFVLLLGHQLTQKVWGWSLPWIDSYFDPLAGTALLLSAKLLEERLFLKKGPKFTLSAPHLAVSFLFIAWASEWLFPRLSDAFTADPMDVWAIAGGCLIFAVLINR